MDRVADGGVGWRADMTPWLNDLGVIVFDPCDKPAFEGIEDFENRAERKQWKLAGDYDRVARLMKPIVGIDYRMVNTTDFTIMYVDLDVHSCGSYHESQLANIEKKPIVVVCEQGKAEAPDWLFGMLPHEMIHGSFASAKEYLLRADHDPKFDPQGRWFFFDAKRLYPRSLIERIHAA